MGLRDDQEVAYAIANIERDLSEHKMRLVALEAVQIARRLGFYKP